MVRFNARFELLAERPHIGRLRPDIGRDVRHSVMQRNYLILYRALPDGAQIVRVVHGSRDLTKLDL
jgi:plasmid stabilization system protein ParE